MRLLVLLAALLTQARAEDRPDRHPSDPTLPSQSLSVPAPPSPVAAALADVTKSWVFRKAHVGLHVVDLETGEEVELDPGEGLLWRAEFDESGAWVLMRVVDSDTNGDGRWDWPHGKPDRDESPCTSPVPEYRMPVVPNDKPSTRVAPAAGGQVRRARGYVTGFGAGGFVAAMASMGQSS